MCSDNRQEFILLSVFWGEGSMLVDVLDHVGGPGLSESTVLGPPDSSESLLRARAFFCGKRTMSRWRCP